MPNIVEIEVRVTDNATAAIASIKTALDDVSKTVATPRIDLQGAADADLGIQAVSGAIDLLGHKVATPKINLQGGASAVTQATAVTAALNAVGGASGNASSKADQAGSSFGGMGGGMIALIGAGVALAPVILTVGTGLGGLGLAAFGTIDPIMKASQATGGLQANMGSLSPVQQTMAQQLLSLEGTASKFATSLQPEVVSIWGSALKLAGGVLGDIQPVAKATGDALAIVVGDIGSDLKTQEWQQFFQWMAANAGPDVQQLGQLFIALMNDLPPLIEELQPLSQALLEVATQGANVAGVIEAINPVVSSNALAADKAAQSNTGFWGSLMKFIDNGKLMQSELLGVKQSTDGVTSSTQKAAPAVQAVVSPTQQLSNAMGTASANTTALSNAWNILVGNFNSEQQAIVNAKQAVDNYGQSVKQNGAASLTAQGQFYSAVQSIQQMVDAEVKNHAPSKQMYDDIELQIQALKSKGPLNASEKQDLINLQKAADAAAQSTTGLSSQETSLAGVMEKSLLPDLKLLHTNGTTLNDDMKALATSILNTGTQSTASKSARDIMIADLEQSGVNAKTAKTDVDNFISSLKSIPASVKSTVTVVGSGSGTITFAEQDIKNAQTGYLEFHAAGGKIGGTGSGDVVPAMLEPGELVVPKQMVQSGEVDHLRGRLPGFAAGGIVNTDQFANASSWMLSAEKKAGESQQSDAAAKMIADAQAKIAAAAAAVTAAAISSAGVSNSSAVAALQSAAAKAGWTGAEWTALNNVEMREAGYNLTATNPSSGAYGMAQFINGPSEYAQYGGNSTTAAGQATAMVNYIKQRYGDPEAAWQHELSYGWYDQGGWLKPGYTLAYNGTGKPEPVGGGGDVHITLELGDSFRQAGLTSQQLEDIRFTVRTIGGGSTQAAFGRP